LSEESLTAGPDGRPRCSWGASAPEYLPYHDREWGRPVTDDHGLFQRFSLEAFQSGLSWLTILRKRDAFREAFAGFEIERVAAFDDADVARLLADAGIVRNRAKIEATIANARAAAGMRSAGESFADLVWSFRPSEERIVPNALAEVASVTPESKALARELKGRGFRFVGPTTAYASMQACGIVNDHLAGCWVRDEVEAERLRALSRAASQ
jgi:DNA-3-methyladenine glycosylase I